MENDRTIFEYGLPWRIFAILAAGVGPGFSIRMLLEFDQIRQPFADKVWMIVFMTVFFSAIAIPLLIEVFVHRIVFSDGLLAVRSPWRKPRTVDIRSIVGVRNGRWSHRHEFSVEGGDDLNVSNSLQGHEHLIELIHRAKGWERGRATTRRNGKGDGPR